MCPLGKRAQKAGQEKIITREHKKSSEKNTTKILAVTLRGLRMMERQCLELVLNMVLASVSF